VFDSELAGLRPQAGRIPMYSTVTGQLIEGTNLDAGYWFDNVRREVAFSAAVETLAGAGHRVFIEVSPHPVLTTAIAETLDEGRAGRGAGDHRHARPGGRRPRDSCWPRSPRRTWRAYGSTGRACCRPGPASTCPRTRSRISGTG